MKRLVVLVFSRSSLRLARSVPLLALALVSSAAPARADDGDKADKKPVEAEGGPAIDPGFPPFSVRFKVLTAGLLVTGAAWGVSYAAARGWPENQCHITLLGSVDVNNQPCSSGPPGSNQLGIPVAGPWIALGKSGCASDDPNCSGALIGVRAALYVLDGIVQAAGLALVLESIIMKTEPPGGPAKKTSAFTMRYRGVELAPLPIVTRSMSGLGITGTF